MSSTGMRSTGSPSRDGGLVGGAPSTPASGSRAVDRRQLVLGLVWLVAGVTVAYFRFDDASDPGGADALATVATAAAVICLTPALRPSRGWAVRLYTGLFLVFHMSWPVIRTLGVPIPMRRERQFMLWYEPVAYSGAVTACTIALCALLGGAFLAAALRRRRVGDTRAPADVRGREPRRTGPIAFAVCGLGCLAWLASIVVPSGVEGLVASYADFLSGSDLALRAYGNVLTGLGLILAVAAPPSRWRTASIVMFGCWAAVAVLIGLRGEVLFPVAASAAIVLPRITNWRPWLWATAAVLLIAMPALAAIGVVRNDRDSASLDQYVAEASPTGLIAELGTTVRVPVEAMRYEQYGYEPFPTWRIHLDTVRYSVAEVVPAPHLLRFRIGQVLNALAVTDSGIGSSMVAEAYLSGGVLVLVLTYLVLGFLLGRLDRSGSSVLLTALILFPLFVAVRNELVFVPRHIAFGLLLLWTVRGGWRDSARVIRRIGERLR